MNLTVNTTNTKRITSIPGKKAGKLYRTFSRFPLKLKKVRGWTVVFETPGFGREGVQSCKGNQSRNLGQNKGPFKGKRKSSPPPPPHTHTHTHAPPRPQSLRRFVPGNLVAELSGLFDCEGVGVKAQSQGSMGP